MQYDGLPRKGAKTIQKMVLGVAMAALLGLTACQEKTATVQGSGNQTAEAVGQEVSQSENQAENQTASQVASSQAASSIEVAGLKEKWVLVGFSPFGVHRLIKSQAYLDLQDMPRAKIHAGCQTVSAAVTVQSADGVNVSINGVDGQSGDAQCEADDLQTALVAALQKANGYSISDTEMVLRTSDGQQLHFTRELDDLANLRRKWALVEFAPFSVHHLVKAQASMDLTKLPKVRADMGCNSMAFEMTFAESGQAKAGDVMSTKMACEDMQLEQAFVQAIAQPSRYRLTGNGLYLVTGDEQVLRFAQDTLDLTK